MHTDLQLLIHLQELDTAAETARRLIAGVPAAQAALEARIAAATGAVDEIKARIAAAQATRREVEKDLAAVETRLSKFKGQLMEVKTNKEYQAMQKEMARAEHDIRAHLEGYITISAIKPSWNPPVSEVEKLRQRMSELALGF